ncbi:MAG: hypothetical protein LBT97_09725 [Planctomycetota bacterium]|nr:hypothetical protein [Planctomycetota bacterium]
MEAKIIKELWLAVSVDLCFHPKLISTAMVLAIDEAHALGILVRMWLLTFKYAKDGDLWRGDEESTYRFVAIVTGYRGDVVRLVEVLRNDRWLDGWLIHDWLDYVGPFLIKALKTSGRPWLTRTWAKYGKTYGARQKRDGEWEDEEAGEEEMDREPPDNDDDSPPDAEMERNQSGSDAEAARNQNGSKEALQPKPLQNPIPRLTNIREIEPKTLSPPAQGNKKQKAQKKGGLGDIAGAGEILDNIGVGGAVEPSKNKGFLHFVKEGGRAEGLNTPDFPLNLVTIEDVYACYRGILRFSGIITTRQFGEKLAYCKVPPATWTILFQDKVHAAYRERDGGTLVDTEGADPVAMTIAALRPARGGSRHIGTEASTNLFVEAMIDFAQALVGGQTSVWQNRLSGNAIAFELDRRKGKRGRIRSN